MQGTHLWACSRGGVGSQPSAVTQCPQNRNDPRAAGGCASRAANSARVPAKFLLRHSARRGQGRNARSARRPGAPRPLPVLRPAAAAGDCWRKPASPLERVPPASSSAGRAEGREAGPRLFTSGRAAASRGPVGMCGSSRRSIQLREFAPPLPAWAPPRSTDVMGVACAGARAELGGCGMRSLD